MSRVSGTTDRTCRFCAFLRASKRPINTHENRKHGPELEANKPGAPCPPGYEWCDVCFLRVASMARHQASRYHIDRARAKFGAGARARHRTPDNNDDLAPPPPKAPRAPPLPVDDDDTMPTEHDDDQLAGNLDADHRAEPPRDPSGAAPGATTPNRQGAATAPHAREFLPDRDDSAHFNDHPRCGEASLIPLRVSDADQRTMATRLKVRDATWRRWRIVKVSPTEVCTVYPLDFYDDFDAAIGRQSRNLDRNWEQCVQEVQLSFLDEHGWRLGPDAITMNYDYAPDQCCECGLHLPDGKTLGGAVSCQGFFPPCFNRRSFCKRGTACADCYARCQIVEKPRPKPPKPSERDDGAVALGGGGRGRGRGQGAARRPAKGASAAPRGKRADSDEDSDDGDSGRRKVYYLCRWCRAPPIRADCGVANASTRELACSEVFGPRDLRRPRRFADVEPPGDAPDPPTRFLTHPADTRPLEEAATRRRQDAERRQLGVHKTHVATELLRAFRLTNMSTDQQEATLRALRACDSKRPGDGLNLNDNVPADKATLDKYGAPFLPASDAVPHHSIMLDAEMLMQGQGRTQLTFGSIRDLVQDILDDKHIPSDAFHFEHAPQYVRADGTPVFGPEPWQGQHWAELARTVPCKPGHHALMLVLWSDKFEAMKDTRHAFTLTVMNVSLLHALKFYGTRLLAVLPKIVVRMPHGTNQNEGMDTDQQALKRQLVISAIARALAAGDTPDGVKHRLRSGDVVCLHYRLFAYVMDLEEQWLVCAMRKDHSNRDLSHAYAHELEPKTGSTSNAHNGKPFLRCASAEVRQYAAANRRTPQQHLQLQQNYLQMCDRDYAAGDAENLQKKNGVFAEVEQQLHRLHHLVRWETGGLYGALAFDYLHTFGLGIFSKFIHVLDAVFRRFYAKSPAVGINTVEDVRDLWDRRLGAVPPFFDGERRLLTWKHWWAEQKGTISGDDYEAVLLQLFYVYANCDVLIGDADVRATVVAAHMRLLRMMRELRVPAWRDAAEFDRLDAELSELAQHLKKVQLLLDAPWPNSRKNNEKEDGNTPGNGFDIPKVVEMLHAARDMHRRGFPSTYSAGSKECVGVKQLKIAVRRTTRHRSLDFGEHVFCKSVALDETRRLADGTAADDDDDDYDMEHAADLDPTHYPEVVNSSRTKGAIRRTSSVWGRACDSLVGGLSGPSLQRAAADDLLPLARRAMQNVDRNPFGPGHCYPSMRIALSARRKLTLSSGVCVLLRDRTYAQVIVVLKPAAPRPHAVLLTPFARIETPDGTHLHPAFRRTWLKRDTAHVLIRPFTDVLERAFLIPVMGDLHAPPPGALHDHSATTYVVEDTLWWRNLGDPRKLRPDQEPIYRVCPKCDHHVPQPINPDAYVQCGFCATPVHW